MRINEYTMTMDIKVDLTRLEHPISLYQSCWPDQSQHETDECYLFPDGRVKNGLDPEEEEEQEQEGGDEEHGEGAEGGDEQEGGGDAAPADGEEGAAAAAAPAAEAAATPDSPDAAVQHLRSKLALKRQESLEDKLSAELKAAMAKASSIKAALPRQVSVGKAPKVKKPAAVSGSWSSFGAPSGLNFGGAPPPSFGGGGLFGGSNFQFNAGGLFGGSSRGRPFRGNLGLNRGRSRGRGRGRKTRGRGGLDLFGLGTSFENNEPTEDDEDENQEEVYTTDVRVKSNRWQRIVITYTKGTLTTYVDGKLCHCDKTVPGDVDGPFSVNNNN